MRVADTSAGGPRCSNTPSAVPGAGARRGSAPGWERDGGEGRGGGSRVGAVAVKVSSDLTMAPPTAGLTDGGRQRSEGRLGHGVDSARARTALK